MTSDNSHHTFSNVPCIEANILIDKDGNARIAGFGHVTIVPDSTDLESPTLSEDSEDSEGSGTSRWMGPELLDPERFGAKGGRPTMELDCYALGMVVLEVLTGKVPFQRYNNLAVMRKIVEGEHPDRPDGPEAVWFTDELWRTLEQCWSYIPELRPAAGGVLECLEQHLVVWQPLSPSIDSYSRGDPASAVSRHTCMFFYLVFLSRLTRAMLL